MSGLAFTDQRGRLLRILGNSLSGSLYDSSVTEDDGRMLVLHAHRPSGTPVTVRFRAVQSSEATAVPEPNAPLRLQDVSVGGGGCLSLLGPIIPALRSPGRGYARVRIEAGAARLDIVCQDAEWWEDEGPKT
jgi:hypothetical protein